MGVIEKVCTACGATFLTKSKAQQRCHGVECERARDAFYQRAKYHRDHPHAPRRQPYRKQWITRELRAVEGLRDRRQQE
jgi:hypothetical protein